MAVEKELRTRPQKRKKNSTFKEAFRRLTINPLAVVCMALIVFFIFVIIFADVIVPYQSGIKQVAANRLLKPNKEHPFGCDSLGRDMFSRMVHGTRTSLTMGIYVTVFVMVVSTILGAMSAYYGGTFDLILMRICDLILSIPGILLALTLVAALGPGRTNLLIAIGLASIPAATRQFRALMLNVIANDYIDAAKAYGCSDLRIMVKHIIPNVMSYIVLSMAGGIAGMIMQISALSFIGMGIQHPEPEWGVMFSESRKYMSDAPFLMIIPGVTILIVTLTLNLLGDALRDVLDPRLKAD